MYGFIYNTLRGMVVEKHGEEVWKAICSAGGVSDMSSGLLDRQTYDEAFLAKIGGAAAELLGVPLEQILEDFGGFFFKTVQRSGHSSLMRTLGHNLYGFLMNLDTLHDHLSFTYPEMRAPSFRCEKTRTGLTLHYYSERHGLVNIVLGIVKAVARKFYRLEQLDISLAGYEEEQHLRHRHHYVIKIEAPDVQCRERLRGEHSSLELELQLLAEEDLASRDRLSSVQAHLTNRSNSTGQVISMDAGVRCELAGVPENDMPSELRPPTPALSATPSRSATPACPFSIELTEATMHQQLSSASLMQMPHPLLPALSFSRLSSRRGSVMFLDPDWPITPQLFQSCFPFHIIFDRELVVRHMGVSLQRLFPHALHEARLPDLFELLRPSIRLTYASIRSSINNFFIVATRQQSVPPRPGSGRKRSVPERPGAKEWLGSKERPESKEPLQFRGQMVPTSQREGSAVLFLASPRISSLEELEQCGLYLSDIPLHDVSRDLILLNRHFRVEMRIARELEETKRDLELQKAQVQEEKARADRLLHAMLPPSVARELKEGSETGAMEYSSVTILFSDIKGFTTICNRCTPMQVVSMLNHLYTLFDDLIETHNVYKVETIGDAYMVAGGLIGTSGRHAEAITNMAFGMRRQARRVLQPCTAHPLQIRIGIHSGPVVAGVVGKKMPRYCLFGDTVNTASRMESHGEPGNVHISEATYQLLLGEPYRFFSRGRISIKGLGEKQTYFVEPEYVRHNSESRDSLAPGTEAESAVHPSSSLLVPGSAPEWDTVSSLSSQPSDSFLRSPSFVRYHKILPVSFSPPPPDLREDPAPYLEIERDPPISMVCPPVDKGPTEASGSAPTSPTNHKARKCRVS